jgi:predicted nucleic acid-binding protein
VTALLDTSVASLFLPGPARPQREIYARHLAGRTQAVSFQTVAELWQLAERNVWGQARRRDLERVLARFLVVPFDGALCETWARVRVHSAAQGRPLDVADSWIAATAVLHRMPLYAEDRDFIGLSVPGLEVHCLAP